MERIYWIPKLFLQSNHDDLPIRKREESKMELRLLVKETELINKEMEYREKHKFGQAGEGGEVVKDEGVKG